MNLLDLLVAISLVAAVLGGWRAGFLARVGSWAGIAVGFYVALRLLPTVLSTFDVPNPQSRLLLAATVLVVGAFLGQALGLVLGHQVRGVLPLGGARTADHVIGAVAGAISVIVGLWLFLPTLADVPGTPSRAVRNSAVARFIDSNFPRPPDATQAVRRLVEQRGIPRVFDALRPAPDAGVPPVASGLSPAVEKRVRQATVKVIGEACNRIQEGSGFVAAQNVVVTNAHVVAGEPKTDVIRDIDGRRLPATVVTFDANRDLAVLFVDGLSESPLGRATASSGATGAVFGHPGGQAQIRAAPARISSQVTALGSDIYGRGSSKRDVFILAANLRPGDSGGALVNQQGQVVGVAFAIAPDRPGTAYALTGSELDAELAAFESGPKTKTSTGRCLE